MREVGKAAEGTENEIEVHVTDRNFVILMGRAGEQFVLAPKFALDLAKLLVEAATGEKK